MGTNFTSAGGLALLALALLVPAGTARGHCDTMDGPVVKAGQRALDGGNADPALAWVQPGGEPEVRAAFGQALAVRKLGPEARALADRYFLETLVRVHRAGEGEPYTGLKPAGQGVGPAVAAADKAIESGSPHELAKLIVDAAHDGIARRFAEVTETKGYDAHDVVAGRRFVRAYVAFVHYAERLHALAAASPHDGHGGHAAPTPAPAPDAHGAHAGH